MIEKENLIPKLEKLNCEKEFIDIVKSVISQNEKIVKINERIIGVLSTPIYIINEKLDDKK